MKSIQQPELPDMTPKQLDWFNAVLFNKRLPKGPSSSFIEDDLKSKYKKKINRSFQKDKELFCAKKLPEMM